MLLMYCGAVRADTYSIVLREKISSYQDVYNKVVRFWFFDSMLDESEGGASSSNNSRSA